jgi:glutaredoxin
VVRSSKKLTLDEYKLQALAHGVRCTANEYLGTHKPIQHQCLKDPNHLWMIRPSKVKRGQGCPFCTKTKNAITLDKYKLQALTHGAKCIADEYLGANTPILHQCLKDSSHEWLVRPGHIKQDHGCPYCADTKISLDQYKLQALAHGYKCIANEYLGAKVPILHQCLKDSSHEWLVRPGHIKNNYGCPYCAKNVKPTLDQYKLQAITHGVRCTATKYLGANTPISHQCLKDLSHEWKTRPSHILQGCGCPYCNNLIQEPRCRIWFENYFQKKFLKIRPKWLKNNTGNRLELDGYCEELKIAFEYNGAQHYEHCTKFHKTVEKFENQQRRDSLKMKLCAEHGVKLIIIPYWIKDIEAFLTDIFNPNWLAL